MRTLNHGGRIAQGHRKNFERISPRLKLPRAEILEPGLNRGDLNGDAPRRYYMNYTGCGNSLNFDSPAVIRLVMDSLRCWVETMHVDGFRFDLASVLGRGEQDGYFKSSASFFDAVSQDPVLNRAIMIAEPWDIGTYQVGNFPVDWSEWNGKFRDTMRRFGKGDTGQLADLGWRLTGSSDLYGEDGRSAYNSINFITCHDGFTLHDLVSYNSKHNEQNGENNQDGASDNNSWNCGAEGNTEDPAVLTLRKQLMKNYVCYLLFASGTPMMLGGDEFARSQRGNNIAYCQDNEMTGRRYRGTTISSNSSAKRLGLRAAFRSCRTGSFSSAKTSTMIRCRTLLGLRRT